MSDPALSVVVPHYGDPEPTLALCAQLVMQGVEGGLEVIVADDCSPIAFPQTPGVRVVRRETNGGYGSAVNTGARLARGDLLLILNSDTDLPAGFVADFVAAAQPFQPGVFGPLVRTNGQVVPTARRWPTAARLTAERVELLARARQAPWGLRAVGIDPIPHDGQVQACEWVAGIALLLPRSAFEAVGGFDERFFMYAEEVDLQRRLTELGVASYLVGAVEVGHVGGASSDPARTRQWLADSRMRYADKWGGAGGLTVGLLASASLNLVTGSLRRLLGRPTTPVHTFVESVAEVRRARLAVRCPS